MRSTIIFALVFLCANVALGQNVGCQNFLFDECPDSGICDVQVLPFIDSAEVCQQICQSVMPTFCESFAYSADKVYLVYIYCSVCFNNVTLFNIDQNCVIIDCPMAQWQEACQQIGGPLEPKVDKCVPVADAGCDAFRKSECTAGGNAVQDQVATDATGCQVGTIHLCMFEC